MSAKPWVAACSVRLERSACLVRAGAASAISTSCAAEFGVGVAVEGAMGAVAIADVPAVVLSLIWILVELLAYAIGAAGVVLLTPMRVLKVLAVGVLVVEPPLISGDGANVLEPLISVVLFARLRFFTERPGLSSSFGAVAFSAARPALTHLLRKALDWVLTIVLL
jgi:hypothetical protein